MKKVNVKKEILVVLLIVVAMVAISNSVFASGIVSIPGLTTDANAVNDGIVNIPINTNAEPANTVIPTPVNNTVVNNTTVSNQERSRYNNETLPKTGDAEDYAIFAVIGVSIIIAIYAYKKVRDYNI